MKTKFIELWMDENAFNLSGIFKALYNYIALNELEELDFLPDEATADVLDGMYFMQHSGDKVPSLLYERTYYLIVVKNSGTFEQFINVLCKMLYLRYKVKWGKIWDAMNAEYNPIENYDSYETRTPNLTDELKNTGDDKTSINKNTDDETYSVGFNSNQEKQTGKLHSEGSAANNYSKLDYNSTHTTKKTGTETIERHGNNGVTTSQHMIESELELRKNDIYDIIFDDVDSLIANQLYFI